MPLSAILFFCILHNCCLCNFKHSVYYCILSNVDSRSSLHEKKDSSDKGGISANATSYATSCGVLSKSHEKTSYGEPSDGVASSKVHGEPQSLHSRGRPSSSASSSSDYAGGVSASSGPGLSPSSSMGSLSSEKSTLNPHAKVLLIRPCVFLLHS